MKNRITNAMLERQVNRLNTLTGSAKKPYTNGKANIGNYHIGSAYGGVRLERIESDGGGIRVISSDGYGTKRQLYTFLEGMLYGFFLYRP